MTTPIVRVTARDLDLDDERTEDLAPGMFAVICVEPLYVAREQHHGNGTVTLTLRRRTESDQ